MAAKLGRRQLRDGIDELGSGRRTALEPDPEQVQPQLAGLEPDAFQRAPQGGRAVLELRHPARLRALLGRDDDADRQRSGRRGHRRGAPVGGDPHAHASAPAVGALNAAGWSAWAVFGLVAGVWVDRLSRRPLLVGTDLLRLVLIGSVPVAWIFGVLTIWQLLAVAAIAGTCSAVFGLAYTSYVPDAVAAEDLTEANARLELSNSAAFLSGPSLAGALISAAGAPAALVVDAASFALSALMLGRGRGAPARAARRPRRRFRAELGEGIRQLRARPALLRVALAGAVANFGFAMVQAVLFVYAYRTLHLSAAVVGGALTIGAAGTVTGALQTQRLTRQLGTARSLFVPTVGGNSLRSSCRSACSVCRRSRSRFPSRRVG